MSRRPQQPGSSSSSTSRSSSSTTPSPWQTTSLAWLQPEVVGSTVALSSLEMASRSYCCRGRGSEEESLLREKVLANLANLAHSFTCSSPSPHAFPFLSRLSGSTVDMEEGLDLRCCCCPLWGGAACSKSQIPFFVSLDSLSRRAAHARVAVC